MPFSGHQKKTGEVARIVFKTALDNPAAILGGRLARGNGSGIVQIIFNYMLYAACSVIERFWMNVLVPAKEITTLIECYGMGEHASNVFQLHSGRCY